VVQLRQKLRSTRTLKISLLTRVQSEFMIRGFEVVYIQPWEDHGKTREKQPADNREAHEVKIRCQTKLEIAGQLLLKIKAPRIVAF
jgi:hypothetical protein